MDSHQQWSDFHFLNSAFVDVAEAQGNKWIQTSLVRLAYRGGKDRTIGRSVKGIDGLVVDYAVPFPATFIFPPRVLQVYCSIFVFLLQIRRAKTALERILVRGAIANAPQLRTELKVFYAMRSKLSWFVKCVLCRWSGIAINAVFNSTLLNFLTTYVRPP
jgi:gamma-tubulin complex component 5